MGAALWTVPFPDAEVFDLWIDASAAVTCLTGRIERIHLYQISMSFVLLVLKHGKEL